MFLSWLNLPFSALHLALDSQQVIASRLIKLSMPGPGSQREASRMVTEKISALMDAQLDMAHSIATGKGHLAPARAIEIMHKKVRANKRRLAR